MSGTGEQAIPRGGGRILMVSTFTLAAVAAAVLTLGTEDLRLLRLGLVAALWAALLAAFAAARVRREAGSYADRTDQLQAGYQLELEREVAAQRQQTVTVERELREQAERAEHREITELRAEFAAMRAHLERLLGGHSQEEWVTPRAVPTNVVPLPTHSRTFDDSRNRTPAATAAAAAMPATAATAALAVAATRRPTSADLGFGPGHLPQTSWKPAVDQIADGQGRHGVPCTEWPGPNGNGSQHSNGSDTDGFRAHGRAARPAPDATQTAQRTVSDLLAAHGAASVPRRRRSQEDTPPAG